MKLTVNRTGAYLDGQLIKDCTQVDLKNISRGMDMEAVLHVYIHEADIQWEDFDARRKVTE